MTDIIGTPVERVIPEGWSVLRDADVKVDDAIGGYKKWERVGSCVSTIPTIHTDGDGWVKLGVDHYLVIRRNAWEKTNVEEGGYQTWLRLIAEKNVFVDELKAKDAEIEELKRLRVVECKRADNYSNLLEESRRIADNNAAQRDDSTRRLIVATNERDELKAKIEELKKEVARWKADFQGRADAASEWAKRCFVKDAQIDRLKADVHKWSEANQANLARADAADAKMCAGFQAEVDRLKAEADKLNVRLEQQKDPRETVRAAVRRLGELALRYVDLDLEALRVEP